MSAEGAGAAVGIGKMLGGTAAAGAIGAALAAVVVMCMTLPRSAREWAVALISTVMGSIGGGAFVVKRFELLTLAQDEIGLMMLLGVAFACGLPAWAVVRWIFTYLERRKNADIGEIADELLRRKREIL